MSGRTSGENAGIELRHQFPVGGGWRSCMVFRRMESNFMGFYCKAQFVNALSRHSARRGNCRLICARKGIHQELDVMTTWHSHPLVGREFTRMPGLNSATNFVGVGAVPPVPPCRRRLAEPVTPTAAASAASCDVTLLAVVSCWAANEPAAVSSGLGTGHASAFEMGSTADC